jgi:hypothetical protein
VNTITHTTPEQVPLPTTTRSTQRAGANPILFQTIAIGALITTAVGINLTGAMDLCSTFGPIALMVTWFLLPVTGISAIAGAAFSAHRSADRYLTAFMAVGLTAMWLFALVWAQVGDAMDQVAC